MKPNDDFKLGIIKNGKLEPGDEKFMINFDYPDEKYEIIYANIDNDPEKDSYLRSILGAQLKKPFQENVQITITTNSDTGKIVRIAIQLDSEKKLADIFYTTPWGVIKKNCTGIGATTLELKTKRNSIIVVPTKSLAYTKYKKGLEENQSYCYVGSPIGDITEQDTTKRIREYLNHNISRGKKFLVVADSVGPLIKTIGEKRVYRDFFFMVDEIDIYQTDNTYRPKLENVIDYYFKFPFQNRCLVSATISEFSNPAINQEPLIELTYTQNRQRNIHLVHAQNHHIVTKERIEKLYKTTDHKIVIAYNSIRYIRKVIELLDEPLKQDCAILCSPASETTAGEYYKELTDAKLHKRITFLTCTYYVGIDIDDRYDLISISNTQNTYTLLSPAKLTQIAGRCRDKQGPYSETVIFDSKSIKWQIIPAKYREYLLKLASDLKDYALASKKIIANYPKLVDETFALIQTDIIERSKKAYIDQTPISIVRTNIENNCDISYFNIDAIYESAIMKMEVYNDPMGLPDRLAKEGHHINVTIDDRAASKEQLEQEKLSDEQYNKINQQSIDRLVKQLHSLHNSRSLTGKELKTLARQKGISKVEQVFLKRFQELYHYIPFLQLVRQLQENVQTNEKWYKGFKSKALIWALDENHPFKTLATKHLALNKIYTRDELLIKANIIASVYGKGRQIKESEVRPFIRLICDTQRGKNSKGEVTDRILSFNPLKLTGTPVQTIPATTPISDIITL